MHPCDNDLEWFIHSIKSINKSVNHVKDDAYKQLQTTGQKWQSFDSAKDVN